LGYLEQGSKWTDRLYYKDEQKHIEEMKKLYNTFDEDKKPQWLTIDQILEYEKAMLKEIKY
jgi:hypothetical protein